MNDDNCPADHLKGDRCPSCKARFRKVIRVIPETGQVNYRERLCLNCQTKYWTKEQVCEKPRFGS